MLLKLVGLKGKEFEKYSQDQARENDVDQSTTHLPRLDC
jgi:hypothetical protein